jgi:hypothetical protein
MWGHPSWQNLVAVPANSAAFSAAEQPAVMSRCSDKGRRQSAAGLNSASALGGKNGITNNVALVRRLFRELQL